MNHYQMCIRAYEEWYIPSCKESNEIPVTFSVYQKRIDIETLFRINIFLDKKENDIMYQK